VTHADLVLLGRVAVAAAIGYVFGFERQLRGSPAGNRTFALIATTAAAVTAVAGKSSPQAVAGILAGIGFIGAGIVFHQEGGLVRGLTTAATIFVVAGIGIVIGYGHTVLGIVVGAILLLVLEIQHVPFLRFLDASNYADRFDNDQLLNERGGPLVRPVPAAPPASPTGATPAPGATAATD